MQEDEFENLLYSITNSPVAVAFVGIFVGWLEKNYE